MEESDSPFETSKFAIFRQQSIQIFSNNQMLGKLLRKPWYEDFRKNQKDDLATIWQKFCQNNHAKFIFLHPILNCTDWALMYIVGKDVMVMMNSAKIVLADSDFMS